MLHVVSTFVVVLIVVGLYHRRRPQLHLWFMSAAFVVDLVLVVWIEVTRGAVETVVRGPKTLVWVHAAISVGVLVLYIAQIALGRQLLAQRWMLVAENVAISGADREQRRMLHRNLGILFCIFRGMNYLTAFLL